MSSIKDRQRAAARARLEKEMAERAASARKRRQRQVGIGAAIAVVVVVAGTVWLVSSLSKDDKKKATASGPGTTSCVWNADSGGNPNLKKTGNPPATVPNVGVETMTFDTNQGPIEVKMDRSKVACTAASFEYLASKKFYDNTKCHRLVTQGIKVLQCGDPSATGKGYRTTDGTGGPEYQFAEENLPTTQKPAYPAGVMAMAKTQAPASTGSQFFWVYGDSELPPDYTVVGTITKGLDLIQKVAAAGLDDPKNSTGDGHPKLETVINTVAISPAA